MVFGGVCAIVFGFSWEFWGRDCDDTAVAIVNEMTTDNEPEMLTQIGRFRIAVPPLIAANSFMQWESHHCYLRWNP